MTGGRPPAKTAKRAVATSTNPSRAARDAPSRRASQPSRAATSPTCSPEIATMCATPPSRKALTVAPGRSCVSPITRARRSASAARASGAAKARFARRRRFTAAWARAKGESGPAGGPSRSTWAALLSARRGSAGRSNGERTGPPVSGNRSVPRTCTRSPSSATPEGSCCPATVRDRPASRRSERPSADASSTASRARKSEPLAVHGASRRPVTSTKAPSAAGSAARRRDDERGPEDSRWRHGKNGRRENPRRQGTCKRKRGRSGLPRPRRAHTALLSDFLPHEQGHRLHVVRLGEEIEERQPLHGVARVQGRKVACECRRIARDHQKMWRQKAKDPGAHARRKARAGRVGDEHVNRRIRRFLRMKKRLRGGSDRARKRKTLRGPGLKILRKGLCREFVDFDRCHVAPAGGTHKLEERARQKAHARVEVERSNGSRSSLFPSKHRAKRGPNLFEKSIEEIQISLKERRHGDVERCTARDDRQGGGTVGCGHPAARFDDSKPVERPPPPLFCL